MFIEEKYIAFAAGFACCGLLCGWYIWRAAARSVEQAFVARVLKEENEALIRALREKEQGDFNWPEELREIQ